RRHTRSDRDWSSDVCSSDLLEQRDSRLDLVRAFDFILALNIDGLEIKTAIPLLEAIDIEGKDVSGDALLTQRELATYLVEKRKEIGRASCRERVRVAVVGGG